MLMGRELAEIAHEDGIMTSAFKARIPVFCPDLLGSELVGRHCPRAIREEDPVHVRHDEDTMEMMQIAQKTRNSGVITLGSTCSQNMLHMAEISSYMHAQRRSRPQVRGLDHDRFGAARYPHAVVRAVITLRVFGKLLRGATTAYVPGDPSIALPMIITALSQTAAKFMKGRKRPNFSFAGKDMTIDVP